MKVLLLTCVVGFFGLVVPEPHHNTFNYLMRVGVPLAAKIRAAEEAQDFDGSRILGGSTAALGQYPYIGGVVIALRTGFQAVCGSSLLTSTRAVTAAHCWFDGWNQAREFVVVLGSITLFAGGTRLSTNQVYTHPGWDPATARNDIAIINIPFVAYNDVIRNIPLPTGTLLTNDFVGSMVRAAGWGLQSDTGVIGSGQLIHHVTLQVTTSALCQSIYGSAVVTASTMCVSGAGGRSVCSGDTGGPLVVSSGGRDVLGTEIQIGVGSFHHQDSCSLGYPTGFTRVSSFITWINERIYS